MKRTSTTYDLIFLADNEWGNQLMREVAREWFNSHPDCNFVMVYEHAGWELTFHRSDEIVGTANDLAIMRSDRPLPTGGYSGCECRRQVTRPDIAHIETLLVYQDQVPAT